MRVRAPLVVVALSIGLVATACSDDSSATTLVPSTSSPDTTSAPTTVPATTVPPETTTTTTLPAAGPPIAEEGDRNETVEAVQHLLDCNGYGDLVIDGVFGPATAAVVEAAQAALGRQVTGAPDEETFAELARGCAAPRRLDADDEPLTVVGNAAPDDPDVFVVDLALRTTVTVSVTGGTDVAVQVVGPDGFVVETVSDGVWEIADGGDHGITVTSPLDPVTFTLEIAITEGFEASADWIIETNGISYQGEKLSIGDDAATVIDKVFEFLGHGVRGAYDEFDTDWYVIDEPQELGLRGVFIEGLAFLFFGPSPSDPDRPETLERIRFEGPSDDADGNPRPDDYVTTAEGIAVGDTLADLEAAYGSAVAPGSNDEEHWYRYADSGGELCFYFGADEPAGSSPILEIATECRR